MKNSRKVIEKLVELASNDQLPLDLNELSPSHFDFLDEKENIGGFNRLDIRTMAEEQMNKDITEEQVNEVFATLERQFDASIGISWDTIEHQINEVLK